MSRKCNLCAYKAPEGCIAWNCNFINRVDAINAYKQTRWIPVTERLPELEAHHDPAIGKWMDSGPVLVYHNCHKHYFHVIVGIYEEDADGTGECIDHGWIDAECGEEITDVLAWMPLPKPWKGASRSREMELFREMLDAEHIEWHDASSQSYEPPMERTHFEHRGYQWSVIHGYGSYGGPSFIEEDQGLLEIMSNAVNGGDPIGWLTAEEVMQYVKGASDETD